MISHSSKLLLSSRRVVLVVCLAGIMPALSLLPCHATPLIKSLSKISTQQLQNIVITGSGFGTQTPYTGDSSNILFADVTQSWSAGFAGVFNSSPVNDLVTLIVDSRSDSSIVLGGFSGAWGAVNWTLNQGDQVVFDVWNAQTGSGPASIVCFVGEACASTASQTPEPGSLALVVTAIVLFGALRFRRQPRRQISIF